MISEPIILAAERNPDWPTILESYIGQRIIAVGWDNRWVQCGAVSSVGYIDSEDECWLYVKGGGSHSVKGEKVTKEALFDVLSTEYPDHFEWLLFHPELL